MIAPAAALVTTLLALQLAQGIPSPRGASTPEASGQRSPRGASTPVAPGGARGPRAASTPSAPGGPKAPRGEGLLLGLATAAGLQTFFIDGATIEKLGDALAIPRTDGWAVVRLVSGDDGKSHRETVWVGKPGALPPPPPAAEDGCEQTEKAEVTFASGDFIGVDTSLGSSCEGAAHPTTSRELKLQAALGAQADAASPPLGHLLGTEADARLPAEWEQGRKKLGAENVDCLQEEPSATSWTLARHRGRWAVRLLLPRTSEACRGLEGTWDFEVPIAAKIAGSEAATHAQLTAAGPRADVIAAPSGAFVVAIEPHAIRLLASGKEIARSTTGGAVVLTQWSLGKHVERWRREAKDALRLPRTRP